MVLMPAIPALTVQFAGIEMVCVDNTILEADAETEGLFYADFDIDLIREYREREMMGNTFRKVQTYGMLLNDNITEPFIRDGQQEKDENSLFENALERHDCA